MSLKELDLYDSGDFSKLNIQFSKFKMWEISFGSLSNLLSTLISNMKRSFNLKLINLCAHGLHVKKKNQNNINNLPVA